METIRKAKPVERLYIEELRLKIAMKEEAANMKSALAKVSLERNEALDHKMTLESQVEKFNLKVNELEKKLFSEMLLSQKYKDERDELQIEREGALREAEELRKQLAERHSIDPIVSEFSYLQLQEATNYFDPSLKIGEGDYGSMYNGFLHHTQVTIKLLDPNSVQNRQGFDEQVSYLSKLRHPNLVTLMGVCREPWALIYEYLPGGTLEDRLIRHNLHSPAVPWQMRIQIAMDICSALIFLHSTQPNGVSHGGLSPKKLLLDENFTCKITDFGLVAKDSTLTNHESDVHIFGIIVLHLLTGKQADLWISKEVERAVQLNALDSILDPFAGEWPYVQAEQLAHTALRCCNSNINDRPDLASDVWRVLAPMRASCSSLSSLASRDQPPHYFTCPILQEIMEDPHFAADGFTYEAEAIRGWLESGHDTSPMTNMKLAHQNLTPNRALRSLIKEWLQTTSTK
ncbi:U-box domain-containing protein 33-like isoform X1 [Silene latifolia]|uniref:U-box domain-containing protein 33-like isoform X1 n=1 Tax=Silene latifolia TaxID=37657 RepID=UPI003D782171